MKKKIKTSKIKSEFTGLRRPTKKELIDLKKHYKSQKLKFDSNEVADAILKDKDLMKGLLK